MDLSVIIVNYNVRDFLEQCLYSVEKALKSLQGEIYVVDNNSVDGSSLMVREKFPGVKLIENRQNLGFSRANNQALEQASGKYCLLLNPDTLIEEDTLQKCFHFMESNPGCGALGVKMINGKGKYLPESKRSLPTPSVAFFKMCGLSMLFPGSRIFGRYHLGYLDKEKTWNVDVLSGAFMFIRSTALSQTGLLDESFFMYGEDIDISYRLTKAGYKNYYFPGTTIIHYKGESTKKSSINYVLMFYKAMIIFAKKHFSRKNARIFAFLINLAIYFRALLAIARRLLRKSYQVLTDAVLLLSGFLVLTPFWEKYKFNAEGYYPERFYYIVIPSCILIWILSLILSGGYRKPIKIWNLTSGFFSGTIIILVIYALLPEYLRFSRALILLGSLWGIIAILAHRILLNLTGLKDYEFVSGRKKRLLIIGSNEEAVRVENLLRKIPANHEVVGFVSPGCETGQGSLGNTSQLDEISRINKVDEFIFCAGDMSSGEIINIISNADFFPVEFRIASPGSTRFIGSGSGTLPGDLYSISINSIGKTHNKLKKRLFDISSSLVILLFFPVLHVFLKNPKKTFSDSIMVLFSGFTWISYDPRADFSKLPVLKNGILSPLQYGSLKDPETADIANTGYARDYRISRDLYILIGNIFR